MRLCSYGDQSIERQPPMDILAERVNEFKEEQGKLHKNVRIDKLKIEPLGTIHINTIEEEGNG